MDTAVSTAIASISVLAAAWLGFRFVLRQDERRWTREQRADLYVDLLVEVSAEDEWIAREMTRLEIAAAGGDPNDGRFTSGGDDRLPSMARRRLGARAQAWGSEEVIRRWNRLQSYDLRAITFQAPGPTFRVEHGAMWDALQAQIRWEFDQDRMTWWQRVRADKVASDAYDDFRSRVAAAQRATSTLASKEPEDPPAGEPHAD